MAVFRAIRRGDGTYPRGASGSAVRRRDDGWTMINESGILCRSKFAIAGSGADMSDSITLPRTRAKPGVKPKTERPRLYKVILLNDDYTPRDFVVTVLKAVFRMTEGEALGVMLTAHGKGACVVAVFTREVAESKAEQGTDEGRRMGYPLTFTTEREE